MFQRIPCRYVLGAAVAAPFVRPSCVADTIRPGLPTKAYWSNVLTFMRSASDQLALLDAGRP